MNKFISLLLSLLFAVSCFGSPDKEPISIIEIKGYSADEIVFLSSLQGVLAKNGIKLYLSEGVTDFWAKHLPDSGKDIVRFASTDELLDRYKSYLEKYVLCTINNVSIAATVAGPYDAVVVTDRTKPFAAGLTMLEDVRDKSEEWLLGYVRNNKNNYSLDAITQHNPQRPGALIDYAIANNYVCVVCDGKPELMREFYSLIQPNSPKFGFGTPFKNEFKDVAWGAEMGLYTVPSSNTLNLSFFSQFPAVEKQSAPQEIATRQDKDVHYVMIMISDGDNLNWTINGCISNPKYMGSDICPDYPINWMYPPETMNAAGLVHNYYQKNRPRYNYYLGALSGQGYTYPSKHKDLEQYARLTGKSLTKAGLDYWVVMDDLDFHGAQKQVLEKMLRYMPDSKGIFYMDYGNYAKWEGASYMIGDVPVHSFRYRLWLPHNPLEKIAAAINGSSRDANTIDAYSSVVVHAWSYGMEDVEKFISLLDDDVVLVNAAQFIELIKKNVLTNK